MGHSRRGDIPVPLFIGDPESGVTNPRILPSFCQD